MFTRIDANLLVSGQIRPDDVARAVAQGVTMIVNNRPDGEVPGQPAGAEIEAAVTAAGIGYVHIPVSGGFSPSQVEAMTDALGAEGQVLAFCAAGTRSAYLWALARVAAGDESGQIIGKAAAAGYDLSPLRAYLG